MCVKSMRKVIGAIKVPSSILGWSWIFVRCSCCVGCYNVIERIGSPSITWISYTGVTTWVFVISRWAVCQAPGCSRALRQEPSRVTSGAVILIKCSAVVTFRWACSGVVRSLEGMLWVACASPCWIDRISHARLAACWCSAEEFETWSAHMVIAESTVDSSASSHSVSNSIGSTTCIACRTSAAIQPLTYCTSWYTDICFFWSVSAGNVGGRTSRCSYTVRYHRSQWLVIKFQVIHESSKYTVL